MQQQLQKYSKDIAILTRALELKAEEFKAAAITMGKKCPDINAALLYDCGRQREL
jgi:hypothetical protein